MTHPIINPEFRSFFNRKQQPGDMKRYADELQQLVDRYAGLIKNAETDAQKDELQRERGTKIVDLKTKYDIDDRNLYCL